MNVVVVFRGYVLGVVKTLIKKMCLKIIREEPGEERFNGMEWLVVVCFGLAVVWFGCCLVWLCWLLPYRYQVEGFGQGPRPSR
jgi:uncharacterized membrane protein